jgi:hypothetical protein
MTELENTVNDSYIISVKPNDGNATTESAGQQQQRYGLLQKLTEQLQQQYGSEKFGITRKFEVVPAMAAIIRDETILEALVKEGYVVEKQNKITSLILKPDAQDL